MDEQIFARPSLAPRIAGALLAVTAAQIPFASGGVAVGSTRVYWASIVAQEMAVPLILLSVAILAGLILNWSMNRREGEYRAGLAVLMAAIAAFLAVCLLFSGDFKHCGSAVLGGRAYHLAGSAALDGDGRLILYDCGSADVVCVSRKVVPAYLLGAAPVLVANEHHHTIAIRLGATLLDEYSPK